MTIMTLLETLLIGPLKLVFEIVFVIANRVLGNRPGLAIIALSMVVNVLVLPLYRRADAIQEEARDKEAKLREGINHIKKTFSGDERMMILQTYYRQNDYRPTDVLNESVSLLLQIPFFMAAYQLLSNMAMLNGVSFGPIRDLGAPDGMLVMGSIAINVLPIVMTAINILSGMIYSRGLPLKSKIQMYGLAGVFLVLLYDSPAGLVFYWTLNNVFSLVKNMIQRSKWLQKVGPVALFAAGMAAVLFGTLIYRSVSIKRNVIVVGVGIVLMIPMLCQWLKRRGLLAVKSRTHQPNKRMFLLGSLFLTILTGMLIPSTYIAASPQEYVDVSYYHDPNLYVLVATCLAAGTFLVWMRVFYWLSSSGAKAVFDKLVWVLCGVMLVNYMFFGRDLGILFSNLQYADGVLFTAKEEILNLVTLAAVVLIMLILVVKWERSAVAILLVCTIAIGGMSALNMVSIHSDTADIRRLSTSAEETTPRFPLSKTGKNVVVIMLDRALGYTVPYIFNEKPELKEQFAGFTHYNNTVSFGGYTVFGSPAMVGGYEYTPVEMNQRSDVSMVEKHNEALKVLPVLFSENGYQATILDPVYANYQWIPDLSIFAGHPNIDAYLTNGVFVEPIQKQAQIDANYRNFFCFSIMKSMPVVLQRAIYCDATYNRALTDADIYAVQRIYSATTAEGYLPTFMDEYSILCNMDTMTQLTEESINTYMFIDNCTTHEPMLLQTPEYVPAEKVDNAAYEAENAGRFTVNGRTLNVHDAEQMAHYHANMAALLQLGEWFDFLRENEVYDNTRIIIVADHGRDLEMQNELVMDTGFGYEVDVSLYNALLMVKDFDAQEFTISGEFMTNADVPTLALEGLIENPVNPFTGKTIDSSEKYAHDQFIITSDQWSITLLDGTTFLPSGWASVKDDLWNPENWRFSDTQTILTEHVLPQ